jgi:hypothetical protein
MVGTWVTETNAMGSAEVVDCLTTRLVAYSLFKPAFIRQQLGKQSFWFTEIFATIPTIFDYL